jgi:hypothetical protein
VLVDVEAGRTVLAARVACDELGRTLAADGHRERTARMEPTTRGQVHGFGHATLDGPEGAAFLLQARQGQKEPRRVRVARALEEPFDLGLLDDGPGVHHDHALRRFRHHAEVVRDEHDRHPELAL